MVGFLRCTAQYLPLVQCCASAALLNSAAVLRHDPAFLGRSTAALCHRASALRHRTTAPCCRPTQILPLRSSVDPGLLARPSTRSGGKLLGYQRVCVLKLPLILPKCSNVAGILQPTTRIISPCDLGCRKVSLLSLYLYSHNLTSTKQLLQRLQHRDHMGRKCHTEVPTQMRWL